MDIELVVTKIQSKNISLLDTKVDLKMENIVDLSTIKVEIPTELSQKQLKPWHLGNTTVRSPYRLKDGLVALSTSSLQGNLRGTSQDIAFRNLLGKHGIVKLGADETNSVGRKWRSALSKLGFLYPEISANTDIAQNEIGQVDTITPSGWRLIKAESVPAIQECFLRALAAHYIPSSHEKENDISEFSPLRHVLAIMLELERQTGESRLNFIEMAVIVQLTSKNENLAQIVENILNLREKRTTTQINKKKFDRQELISVALKTSKSDGSSYKENTFTDYADANFRYLKATGLVQSKGRGLSIVPEKRVFIEKLVQDTDVPSSKRVRLIAQCEGSSLPTDHQDAALIVLNDLLKQVNQRGIKFDLKEKSTSTPADINIIRHEIEDLLSKQKEEEFSIRQSDEWEEISSYMELIISRRSSKTLPNGNEIEIPKSEAPAYFEWILWRAFLAIDSLVNKPYEARRFKIDQDFLPVGTAPGGGPDLIFEFEDFVIVVEVTLTDNSRQEAAEGEPVRRHVADLVLHYDELLGKKVYGLFIANKIDSNTAETFRIGIWFNRDDEKMRLDIIPITLQQFKTFFETLFVSNRVEVGLIRELLELCGDLRLNHEAPEWKKEIDLVLSKKISLLNSAS